MPGQVFRENMRQRKQPRPANWAPTQASLNQAAPARAKRSALTFLIQLLVQLLSGAAILAFVWFFVFDAPLPTLPSRWVHNQHVLDFLDRNRDSEARKFLLAMKTPTGDPPKWWTDRLSRAMTDLVENVPLSDQQTKDIMLAAAIIGDEEQAKGQSGSAWVSFFAKCTGWIRRAGSRSISLSGPVLVIQANENPSAMRLPSLEPSVSQVIYCHSKVFMVQATRLCNRIYNLATALLQNPAKRWRSCGYRDRFCLDENQPRSAQNLRQRDTHAWRKTTQSLPRLKRGQDNLEPHHENPVGITCQRLAAIIPKSQIGSTAQG
jgi:hypothetical protein